MIRMGEQIPSMALEAYHAGDVVTIDPSRREGRWLVLLFYPADFTFICPTELSAFADRRAEFEEVGADVMSVSTDTVFTHKAWHDSSPMVGRVSFPMLSDPTGALCRTFGTLLEDEGISLRGTFIVDPDGVVQSAELQSNSIGRNAAETLRKLRAAAYVREVDGEVCPAGWQPGEATLQPSLALVGQL